jgi:hypothetical protein
VLQARSDFAQAVLKYCLPRDDEAPTNWKFQEQTMSKGLDKKKDTKKQPAKTLKEKKLAKREKKQTKG